MAITKKSGRQNDSVAHVTFDFSQVTDDTYMPAIDVPAGAIVTGGYLAITTLFNSATTDQFSIGDQEGSAASSKTTYAALSADVTAAGTSIAIVPNGHKYASPGTVGVVWNGTGAAPTAGNGILVVKYIVDNRAAFSQG
jgi:hypothetical protein